MVRRFNSLKNVLVNFIMIVTWQHCTLESYLQVLITSLICIIIFSMTSRMNNLICLQFSKNNCEETFQIVFFQQKIQNKNFPSSMLS